jgi:hypothetical protein
MANDEILFWLVKKSNTCLSIACYYQKRKAFIPILRTMKWKACAGASRLSYDDPNGDRNWHNSISSTFSNILLSTSAYWCPLPFLPRLDGLRFFLLVLSVDKSFGLAAKMITIHHQQTRGLALRLFFSVVDRRLGKSFDQKLLFLFFFLIEDVKARKRRPSSLYHLFIPPTRSSYLKLKQG